VCGIGLLNSLKYSVMNNKYVVNSRVDEFNRSIIISIFLWGRIGEGVTKFCLYHFSKSIIRIKYFSEYLSRKTYIFIHYKIFDLFQFLRCDKQKSCFSIFIYDIVSHKIQIQWSIIGLHRHSLKYVPGI